MVLVVSLVFLFVIVAFVIYLVTIYNGLVAIKNDIDKAWANIDVLLKQRHDELTKLLDTTKGYMEFERDTLTKITQARSQYQQAVTVRSEGGGGPEHDFSPAGIFRSGGELSRIKSQYELPVARKTHLRTREPDRRPT